MSQATRLTKREKRIQRQNRRKSQSQSSTQSDPSKINFSLRDVEPLTNNQRKFFNSFDDGAELIMLIGSAGTGKSFIALYKSLEELLSGDTTYKKVVIVRSAVQSREIGHMPGSAKEKVKLFEQPYNQICSNLFDAKEPYQLLSNRGVIEFTTTSFIRGLTFDDSIIIVDECQNMNWEELSTIMTRVGDNSRIVFCGDYRQSDLYRRERDKSGLRKFHGVITKMKSSVCIEFKPEDIVRSKLVKEFLMAVETIEDEHEEREDLHSRSGSILRPNFGDRGWSRESLYD